MENKLEIKSVTKKDKTYKNLVLKDMENGDSVIVSKTQYAEGQEKTGDYGPYFIVSAEYMGEEVGFFLKPEEHTKYAGCGQVGDSVRITMAKGIRKNKAGKEYVYKDLSFEKV